MNIRVKNVTSQLRSINNAATVSVSTQDMNNTLAPALLIGDPTCSISATVYYPVRVPWDHLHQHCETIQSIIRSGLALTLNSPLSGQKSGMNRRKVTFKAQEDSSCYFVSPEQSRGQNASLPASEITKQKMLFASQPC